MWTAFTWLGRCCSEHSDMGANQGGIWDEPAKDFEPEDALLAITSQMYIFRFNEKHTRHLRIRIDSEQLINLQLAFRPRLHPFIFSTPN